MAHDFNVMADELHGLTRGLERRVEERTIELERRNEDLDAFAHVVSHDLKAPMRGARLHAQLAREALGPRLKGAAATHLRTLEDRIERMNWMLDGILAYSRAGRQQDPAQEVDVESLVRRVGETLDVPRGFHVVPQPPMPTMLARELQLSQVLQNLIGNAVKHHDRQKGTVTVRARDLGPTVEFVVEDDGPGIAPQDQERLFRLFSVDARQRPGSSGVGLSVAKKLVEANGGTIRFEPVEPRGSRFRFTWGTKAPTVADAPPRAEKPVALPAGVPVAGAPSPRLAPGGLHPRPGAPGVPVHVARGEHPPDA